MVGYDDHTLSPDETQTSLVNEIEMDKADIVHLKTFAKAKLH